jgi:hypothetical protein
MDSETYVFKVGRRIWYHTTDDPERRLGTIDTVNRVANRVYVTILDHSVNKKLGPGDARHIKLPRVVEEAEEDDVTDVLMGEDFPSAAAAASSSSSSSHEKKDDEYVRFYHYMRDTIGGEYKKKHPATLLDEMSVDNQRRTLTMMIMKAIVMDNVKDLFRLFYPNKREHPMPTSKEVMMNKIMEVYHHQSFRVFKEAFTAWRAKLAKDAEDKKRNDEKLKRMKEEAIAKKLQRIIPETQGEWEQIRITDKIVAYDKKTAKETYGVVQRVNADSILLVLYFEITHFHDNGDGPEYGSGKFAPYPDRRTVTLLRNAYYVKRQDFRT